MISFRIQDSRELPLHHSYADFPTPGYSAERGAQVFPSTMLHDIVVNGSDDFGDYGGKWLVLIDGRVTSSNPYDIVLPEDVRGVSFHDTRDVERMIEELIERTGMDEYDASEMLVDEMAAQATWGRPKWTQTLDIPDEWMHCDEIEVDEDEGDVVLICDDERIILRR